MSIDDLRERKDRLRKQVRSHRDALSAAERARLSDLIAARFFEVVHRVDPHTVMLFASFGSEIETRGIVEALDREGRRLALPVVAGQELRAVAFRPGDPMRTAQFGVAEPLSTGDLPAVAIDLVVVPGLAFDRHGYRLGYGRGYYDRFLVRTRPDTRRVGLAFSVQTVAGVPHGPWDQPVDCLITEIETICCRAERTRPPTGPDA